MKQHFPTFLYKMHDYFCYYYILFYYFTYCTKLSNHKMDGYMQFENPELRVIKDLAQC